MLTLFVHHYNDQFDAYRCVEPVTGKEYNLGLIRTPDCKTDQLINHYIQVDESKLVPYMHVVLEQDIEVLNREEVE